jgi:predicted protein tyrosine phosphatase
MKFFGKSKGSDQSKQTVLFVCVENAGRSQMAEGFFRKYAPRNYEPISAGTTPASIVNPLAIEVMKEVGIDISKQRPKIITDKLTSNQKKFVAEAIGTFIVVVFATGSVVIDAKLNKEFLPKLIPWQFEHPSS